MECDEEKCSVLLAGERWIEGDEGKSPPPSSDERWMEGDEGIFPLPSALNLVFLPNFNEPFPRLCFN